MFELTKPTPPNNAAATIVPAAGGGYSLFPFVVPKQRPALPVLQEMVRNNALPVIAWRVSQDGKIVEPITFLPIPAGAECYVFHPSGKITSLATGEAWLSFDTFAPIMLEHWKKSMPQPVMAVPKPLASGDVVGVVFR